MLAKKTSKNQITLPKKLLKEVIETDYFNVSLMEGGILLKPVKIEPANSNLGKIRSKISSLGLSEKEIAEAVRWARRASD